MANPSDILVRWKEYNRLKQTNFRVPAHTRPMTAGDRIKDQLVWHQGAPNFVDTPVGDMGFVDYLGVCRSIKGHYIEVIEPTVIGINYPWVKFSDDTQIGVVGAEIIADVSRSDPFVVGNRVYVGTRTTKTELIRTLKLMSHVSVYERTI